MALRKRRDLTVPERSISRASSRYIALGLRISALVPSMASIQEREEALRARYEELLTAGAANPGDIDANLGELRRLVLIEGLPSESLVRLACGGLAAWRVCSSMVNPALPLPQPARHRSESEQVFLISLGGAQTRRRRNWTPRACVEGALARALA